MILCPKCFFTEFNIEMGEWSSYFLVCTKCKNIIHIKIISDIGQNGISRNISKEERFFVLKKQNWKCNICGCKLKYSKDNDWIGEVAHIDHIHPFSKRETYVNGSDNINEYSNLQALCPSCNLFKSKKEIN